MPLMSWMLPPGYHWFDGDGMLHACRIKDGKASYCNRYVETSKLKQEKKAGRWAAWWPVCTTAVSGRE